MPDFRVTYQNTESNDRRERQHDIHNAATAEHAVWEAARQIFCRHHPGLTPAQDLVRVEHLVRVEQLPGS